MRRLSIRSVLAFMAVWALAAPRTVEGQNHDLGAVASSLDWREIGPAIMGGRITDLAVNEANPAHFFVGTATGGLWKTMSHGQEWEPVFDDQSTSSIGAVTLAPSNPNVVWVGTGEPQNRQSSPYGAGVYRSTDGGGSWTFLGLEDTRHIGSIVVHPTDPDVAWVAAVGHLWGPNAERGIYRTTDGGASWEHVLFIDEHTGAIDLVADPADPRTMYAAMYQRQRTAFGFSAAGSGSGLYRTLDGGDSWEELTNGLPDGDKGRIGLDVYRRDGNLVYAIVESSGEGRGIYRSEDRGESWSKMSGTNPRPMYFSLIRIDPNDPERIYIGGVSFGRSDDGGKTFRQGDAAPGIHVDHHALWVDPANSNHLVLGSDGGLSTSWDRSEHWRHINNLALGQFYEIGVSMEEPYTVCGGLQDNSSWCAPHNTLSDYGIRNADWEDVSGGDGFYNKIDPTNPNIIYTESQGGNVVRHDRRTGEATRIRPVARPTADDEDRSYRFNWNAPIHISAHDPSTVFMGANHLLRSTDQGMSWSEASPDLTRQIDRDTIPIMGARVTEETLSQHDGQSNYGTITTIGESPANAYLIYVGTDDGNVQVTRDGGEKWTDVTPDSRLVPDLTYVSSVVPSSSFEGRVYATFDGHWADDYRPYVAVSNDYGSSWQMITGGLPDESVNRIREHPRTPELLFLGNEVGVFFSPDAGNGWHRLDGNLPTVPVDDIVIHPRDNDLILGTHGRSIWILDDVGPLEELSSVMMAPSHLFAVRDVAIQNVRGGWPFWGDVFQGANPQSGALVRYMVGHPTVSADTDSDGDDSVTLRVEDASGAVVRSLDASQEPGLHEVVWDLRSDAPYAAGENNEGGGGRGGRFRGPPQGPMVMPGTYTISLLANGVEASTEFQVLPDPRAEFAARDRAARQAALMSLHELAEPVFEAGRQVRALESRVSEIQDLIGDRTGLPETLKEEVDELASEIDSIQADLATVQRVVSLSGQIQGSRTAPTADQLWQIDQAWEDATDVIERLNAVIEIALPTLNRTLDEQGVRPTVGDPIALPRRPGGP